MASETIISRSLATIFASYPGRVEVTAQVKSVWFKLLEDQKDEHVQAAVIDLCSSETEYPPVVAKVRERAIELSMGELAPVSAYEAWERVCSSQHNDTVVLNDIEKQAMNQIGGTWEIKHGHGNTMGNYIRAYDSLMSKARRLRSVVPAVADVAMQNAPALPSAPERPIVDAVATPPGPSELKELLKGLNGYEGGGE